MAKNIQSLQLLRNSQIFQDKAAAINGITGSTTQDGVIKLARYTEGDETKTIFGIYHDFGSGNAGYTIYDSYQEVIADIQERIADLESGSTEAIEEIWDALGDGVSSANTVTEQLEALSGDTASTSADTSVEGAKRYADDKVAEVVNSLDYTDTAATGEYVSAVDETNGVISVTRVALPSLSEVYEEGKPIIAVSEDKGQVAASAGTINAEYVNVADAGELFTATTVEAVLAEIDAAYKAADAAIVGGASASADTLGELEALINDLSADAKEYHIVKTTTGIPETVKERYSLVDADGNVSGDTVDIPKDSHIVSINYITDTGDTHYQNLEYVYITDSGTTSTTYVDMSQLVLESEFASGVTSTNGVVHGVVDPTSETFLTVGADGFKLSGVQDAIDAAYEGLDATVTGATSGNHITISIEELDGKLVQSGLTISEDNIADADDLAALSAKTITEIASSNNSISATSTAATDGTVSVDLVTDASKIQMSGFTSTDVLSGITSSSSITEAFKEVDKVITENEETVSAALNDLEATKVENIEVNGVSGTVTDNVASVTIDGNDVVLGADYVKPAQGSAIATGDTVDEALGKLEAKVDAATSGGITGATVNNAPLAITSNVLTQTVVGKQSEATATSNEAIVVETDANGNLTLGLANLDAGTY